jgi:cathepsin B
LKYTDLYVVKVNGPGDDLAHHCDQSMSLLGQVEFGNKNDYTPSASDADSLVVLPVDDARVVRASDALAQHINLERQKTCPAKSPVSTGEDSKKIVYARRGMVDFGRGQYKLEVLFGTEVFFARVVHLPKSEQLIEPSDSNEDPENFDGRFAVVHVTPDPCGDAVAEQLAVSVSGVSAINKQGLPWKAMLKGELEGRTVGSFGMGFKPLPEEVRRQYVTSLDTTGFTPPAAYDARDRYASDPACAAYAVLDQGSCGSCYAFAAATAYSARLCRFNPGSVGNVVVSPQEMMDCTNGCDGGSPIAVFQTLLAHPAVELWCDPYTQRKSTCGGVCAAGNSYSAQAGSMKIVGNSGASGVLQIQLELIRSGPGVVCFDVYNDFQSYSSGVYVKSAKAKSIGAHAVTLVGFGVEGGVPYWLIQNSWGPNWGMSGYAKIRRGTNECNIEAYGFSVVKPIAPAVCAAATCRNGATTLKDCSCRCAGGWSGPECGVCSLTCQNGGVLDGACTKCACPPGFSGAQCEGGISVSPVATCLQDKKVLTVSFSFGGTALAPTQKSYIGIYKAGETKTVKQVVAGYLCGTTYNKALNGGLCPAAGSITMNPPTAAGTYQIVLAPFLPTNEFGQSGFSTLLLASNTIGQFTVLPRGCSASALKAALVSNDRATIFAAQQTAANTAQTRLLAEMKARLDVVQPLLSQLATEQPASIDITGLNPTRPLMWVNGPLSQVCYRLPPSGNVNPKALVLYVGDASSYSFYPTGLTGAGTDKPLPADYQGCVNVNIAAGIPAGAYTIKLVDTTKLPVQTMLASISFTAGQASVGFDSYTLEATRIVLKVSWSVAANLASPTDTVKVLNSAGTVVYWFFTSCGCQTTPGGAAVPQGFVNVAVLKQNAVPGGYTPKLYPEGGAAVAAVGQNWVNWAQIGW